MSPFIPSEVSDPTGAPSRVRVNTGQSPDVSLASWTLLTAPAPAAAPTFAEFYAVMPADNLATIASGSDVQFPNDGPASGAISRAGGVSASAFILPVGTFEVTFQLSVTEAGQVVLTLDGTSLVTTAVGRATGTSQIVGSALVTSVTPGSILTLRNNSAGVITLTPDAARALSAHLLIKRLQ